MVIMEGEDEKVDCISYLEIGLVSGSECIPPEHLNSLSQTGGAGQTTDFRARCRWHAWRQEGRYVRLAILPLRERFFPSA